MIAEPIEKVVTDAADPVGNLSAIPIEEIFADFNFNCRGVVKTYEVTDLVESFKQHGQLDPIVITPITNVEGKKYKIISGHRRYTAAVALKWVAIQAIVKVYASEADQVIENALENLMREQLPLIQEGKTVAVMMQKFGTLHNVAKKLGKSVAWVRARYNLSKLPPEIQKVAAEGLLSDAHINEIAGMVTLEEQYQAVRNIKDQIFRNIPKSKAKTYLRRKDTDLDVARQRNKDAVYKLTTHILAIFGTTLHSKLLAWVNGHVSTSEINTLLRAEAEKLGVEYKEITTEF